MERNDLLVATVLKPQGIRGEIKIKTFTDTAEDMTEFPSVWIDGKSYTVLKVRPCGQDCAFIVLRGIADRNAAELLRGKEIFVKREEIPSLPEDTWYIVDLVGCSVVTTEGETIGTLTDVMPAASDVFVAEKDGKSYLFPNVDGLLKDVDLEKKVITLDAVRFSEVVVEP